jgi:hypothetical protein
MSKGDKNQNGKRNTETKIIGKKDRKLSKNKVRIEKLQKVPEGLHRRKACKTGTSSGYQNNTTWHFSMAK